MDSILLYIKKISCPPLLIFLFVSILSCCGKKDEPYLLVDPGESKEKEVLRFISYNILEGMMLDKANNYNNFVAWIKKHDPDILAIQEANGFTQASLEALAKRYNHTYVVTNVKVGDNYPVALTSKHPIELRRRITKNVSHGTIFAKIKNVNVVVTHFWPQPYWHHVGDGKGDEYRLQEIKIVLDSTIRKYPEEPRWLFCGDFNSLSEKDFLEGSATGPHSYEVHKTIEKEGYIDVLHYLYGHRKGGLLSYPSSYPGYRIDFIYGTRSILRDVIFSKFIYDDFTKKYSDHYPMLLDFRN